MVDNAFSRLGVIFAYDA